MAEVENNNVAVFRWVLGYAAFVITASAAAALFLTLIVYVQADYDRSLPDLFDGTRDVFGVYMFTTSISALVMLPIATAYLHGHANENGIRSLKSGALIGAVPTFIIFCVVAAGTSFAAEIIQIAFLFMAVNSTAGAIGGYAYWVTVGRP
jgi:hypothetical protein